MKHVLFLCTGNYYRSRFAEELFNHLAAIAKLPWHADSSGLATELGWTNIGPISPATLASLESAGVRCSKARDPKQCAIAELEHADLIIALKEAEHRPLLAGRYPDWVDKVEYWHVHDLDYATSEVALPEIREQVEALISRLKHQEAAGSIRAERAR